MVAFITDLTHKEFFRKGYFRSFKKLGFFVVIIFGDTNLVVINGQNFIIATIILELLLLFFTKKNTALWSSSAILIDKRRLILVLHRSIFVLIIRLSLPLIWVSLNRLSLIQIRKFSLCQVRYDSYNSGSGLS